MLYNVFMLKHKTIAIYYGKLSFPSFSSKPSPKLFYSLFQAIFEGIVIAIFNSGIVLGKPDAEIPSQYVYTRLYSSLDDSPLISMRFRCTTNDIIHNAKQTRVNHKASLSIYLCIDDTPNFDEDR